MNENEPVSFSFTSTNDPKVVIFVPLVGAVAAFSIPDRLGEMAMTPVQQKLALALLENATDVVRSMAVSS